jgi:hypothetical protein
LKGWLQFADYGMPLSAVEGYEFAGTRSWIEHAIIRDYTIFSLLPDPGVMKALQRQSIRGDR